MHSGKALLKVASVLMIIFGSIAIVISIVALAQGGRLAGARVGAYLGSVVVVFILSMLELVLGVIGLKRSEDVKSASFFIITGVVLSAVGLISLILRFQIEGLIGFALPLLYIAGGVINRHSIMAA